jgi:hypothetical protein
MGGLGSGRWWRWDQQTSLNECLSVDVRDWNRRGLLRAGLGFSWQWSIHDQPTGSISVRVHADSIVVSYVQGEGTHRRSVDETVWLASTACHLGGRRRWFSCPGCQNRAAKLYLRSAYFRCRRCCWMPYACQQESPYDRALRRAQKLRRRLGASPCIGEPIAEKPKGMHWRTFKRLQAEVERREQTVDGHLARYVVERFGRLPG